ncbi:Immunity protein 35 [Pseudoxanthomonas sp. CF385]|uniref:YrhB domain-containing protein n=1 Tax=Pseudoxanthomonas sp. CF385 TaxID=1881042 RepID=UPI00088ED721|nr:YrhB domain-containing protein [Pseudoxanthomonas sp. CF385]SDR03512.1 Immunity protein 35 [Pseudoxanthomonas sp. CF385]
MIDYEEASARVEEALARWPDAKETGDSLVILHEHTLEKPWGWVFFYTSKQFHETGDSLFALAGNAPYIVERETGRLIETGTVRPLDEYIAKYERAGDPMASGAR